MNHFNYVTPLIYLLLVIIWIYIFSFYIIQLSKRRTFDKLLIVLISVLAIDAFRTLTESIFFGTWYTSLAGLIPIEIYNFLAKPEIVFFPKIVNLIVSVIILFILIKKWIPSEQARLYEQKDLIERQTQKLKNTIVNLEKTKTELSQQKQLFESMFNTIPDGVVITNTNREILLANKGMKTTFDYTPEEIVGKSAEILYANRTYYQEAGTKVFDRNSISENDLYLNYYKTKQNVEFTGETYGTKLYEKDGTWIGNLEIMRDITERLENISKLKIAKEKAEESEKLKSAFLANMSHEIRTPMNGIIGFVDLLQNTNLSIENQQKFIGIIKKSADRLLNTVNDIIEISKIASGEIKITKSKIDIISHLETLVTFFKSEAEIKNLEIILQNNIGKDNLMVTTDKTKLDSIFSNLIKNAIKYTKEGTINISLKIENNQILFICQDTGIGIPKNRQAAIFNRFEQADIEDKRVHEGSGLGLAIAKSYVDMLGGKIWVESKEKEGSIFYVSLPYIPVKKQVHENFKNHTVAELKKKNINVLVGEDDEVSSSYISIILKEITQNILFAKNGIEVIEKCKNDSSIDLVLMDIKMPEMNGITATQKIREFNKDIVIIAQTAYALRDDKEEAKQAGCNDFIAKPINKDQLIQIINKYLS